MNKALGQSPILHEKPTCKTPKLKRNLSQVEVLFWDLSCGFCCQGNHFLCACSKQLVHLEPNSQVFLNMPWHERTGEIARNALVKTAEMRTGSRNWSALQEEGIEGLFL